MQSLFRLKGLNPRSLKENEMKKFFFFVIALVAIVIFRELVVISTTKEVFIPVVGDPVAGTVASDWLAEGGKFHSPWRPWLSKPNKNFVYGQVDRSKYYLAGKRHLGVGEEIYIYRLKEID